MSDEVKNPFGEATVVLSRTPAPADSERTIVHSRARAEVKPAAPPKLPKATPPPEPAVYAGTAVVIPVDLDQETKGGVVVLKNKPDSNTSKSERREERKALQRKSRFAFGGAIAVAIVAISFVFVWRSPSIIAALTHFQSNASSTPSQKSNKDLASESAAFSAASSVAEPKTRAGITDYIATTEVQSRFDRASAKAQEKALDFSKTNSGF